MWQYCSAVFIVQIFKWATLDLLAGQLWSTRSCIWHSCLIVPKQKYQKKKEYPTSHCLYWHIYWSFIVFDLSILIFFWCFLNVNVCELWICNSYLFLSHCLYIFCPWESQSILSRTNVNIWKIKLKLKCNVTVIHCIKIKYNEDSVVQGIITEGVGLAPYVAHRKKPCICLTA